MSENTHEMVRAIAASSGTEQTNLIHAFMKSRWGLFKQISWSLCRNFGVSVDVNGEDFTSLIAEDAYKMLTEQINDDEKLERVENWEGMLKVRSRQVVRNFLDKEMAPAAEMTSTLRRVRLLNQTRDLMRLEAGTEPADRDVVEVHNAKMWATRSNPVKQGVLATVEDLQVYRACADVEDHDHTEPIDTEFVLHPVEGPKFIRLLVDKTAAHNERLGQAAGLWLSGLYREDGPPVIGTVEEIAEALDVSKSTARAYIRKIKDFAVIVFQDEFDIGAESL